MTVTPAAHTDAHLEAMADELRAQLHALWPQLGDLDLAEWLDRVSKYLADHDDPTWMSASTLALFLRMRAAYVAEGE